MLLSTDQYLELQIWIYWEHHTKQNCQRREADHPFLWNLVYSFEAATEPNRYICLAIFFCFMAGSIIAAMGVDKEEVEG